MDAFPLETRLLSFAPPGLLLPARCYQTPKHGRRLCRSFKGNKKNTSEAEKILIGWLWDGQPDEAAD